MPEFTTMFRDLGTVPTIIGFAIVALIIYSIVFGGKGGKGGGSGSSSGGSSSGGTSSGGTTPTA
jgi:uncharacterized membrane protein YgcG